MPLQPDAHRRWRVSAHGGPAAPEGGFRIPARTAPALASDAARRLLAVRLMGAGAFAALGQVIVDAPQGYFGAGGLVTRTGAAFALLQVVLFAAGWWTRLPNRRLLHGIAGTLLTVNIVAFGLALGSDPVLAGAVVLWHVALLSRLLFPSSPLVNRPRQGDELGAWLATHGPAVRHFLLVSLVASTVMVGFRVSDQLLALLLCLALDGMAIVFGLPLLVQLWRQGSRFRVSAFAALFVAAIAFAGQPVAMLTILAIYQLLVLLLLISHLPSFISAGEIFFGRPEFLIVWTFIAIIAVGTLLLSFPVASSTGVAVSPVDALFMATSAVCVTGLSSIDFATEFSTFGHVVLMLLMQVGGLNIMVLSAFTAILLGRGLSLRGEKVLGEMLDLQPDRSVYPLVRFIVLATLAIEGAGALLIATSYLRRGAPIGEALWNAVFAAVSGFCNAGFVLHSDNLISFRNDWVMLLTMSALITFGGIGFAVLAAGWARLVHRRKSPFATQVRMVLWASAILVVLGTLLIAAFEWDASLAGLGAPEKWLNALLMSVTTRTAGFNSVDMALLQPASVLIMLVWMFIGASPGGTGGGIKTTTATVLLSILPAIARGRANVVLFRRAVPLEIVYRSAAITVVSGGVAFLATAILLSTQKMEFDAILFEVVSALGTVGLSLGITPRLDDFGKVLIASVMFLGRIGPLTLALLLARQETSRVAFPEARVMVG
jgi:trk system potassium uptake protein TrkH